MSSLHRVSKGMAAAPARRLSNRLRPASADATFTLKREAEMGRERGIRGERGGRDADEWGEGRGCGSQSGRQVTLDAARLSSRLQSHSSCAISCSPRRSVLPVAVPVCVLRAGSDQSLLPLSRIRRSAGCCSSTHSASIDSSLIVVVASSSHSALVLCNETRVTSSHKNSLSFFHSTLDARRRRRRSGRRHAHLRLGEQEEGG